MAPLVYVLVLNYCSVEDTLECVEAVRHLDYSSYRLLVIDNASPDSSGSILRERLPKEEFLQLPTNTGYAGGNNVGIRIALQRGADYVLILNPDVRVEKDCIGRCVDLMQADASIGALNPIQLDGGGKQLDDKFRVGIFSRHGFKEPTLPFTDMHTWEAETLYGAALFLRCDTLLVVGGFDPLFFAYGEEEDLCRRIRRRGFRLVVTSEAAVRHLRSKENNISDFVVFLRLKGLYLFLLKDPARAFLTVVQQVTADIISDLQLRRKDQYPFRQFCVTRTHVLKAAIWLVLRLPLIYRHRLLERGAPYLLPTETPRGS